QKCCSGGSCPLYFRDRLICPCC
uniref:Conotoxin MIIIJ n=2 Tax=Conus magus TaxID=6492 RepID=CM3J_CONMA|nr:RecName: Full=Conotoxin MIIIJ; AltName: Full=AlphaM-MIIIJ [Conus magus]